MSGSRDDDGCRARLPADGLISCPVIPDGHRCIATVGGHLEHPCLCGATFTLAGDQWLREKIRDEERRAGREDAARALEAEADDEARRPGRAEPSELIEEWLREAARIARGIGRFDEEAGDG